MEEYANLNKKRQRTVKHPEMEEAYAEWLHANQDRVNMSGDLLRECKEDPRRLYPDHASFNFKGLARVVQYTHRIRSYHHFGASGPVNMELI